MFPDNYLPFLAPFITDLKWGRYRKKENNKKTRTKVVHILTTLETEKKEKTRG